MTFLKLSRVGMLAGILTILSTSALAHDPGLSAVEVRIFADRIVAEVSFAPSDLQGIQFSDSNVLTIRGDDGQLELRSFSLKSSYRNSVHYVLEFSSLGAGEVRISAPVLANLPRGHKQFCSVYDQENRLLAERMLSAESGELTIDLRSTANNRSSIRFVVLGVEHILTCLLYTSHAADE